MLRSVLATLVILLLGPVSVTFAQGLIWNAPDEGISLRYEGDYLQEDERPNEVEPLKLQWRRHLTLRAFKKTKADYYGETVDCQWFELEVETGPEVDGKIKPGPGGLRIFKVLVPISRITIGPPVEGRVVDADGIPVAYLPVVKGYRRIDDQAEEPITTGVMNPYPMLTLMAHFRTLETVASDEDPQVQLDPESLQEDRDIKNSAVSSTTLYRGKLEMESPTFYSMNSTDLWANPQEVPFGLVRWKVEITKKTKDSQQARDQFQLTSTINIDMKLVAWEKNNDPPKLTKE